MDTLKVYLLDIRTIYQFNNKYDNIPIEKVKYLIKLSKKRKIILC